MTGRLRSIAAIAAGVVTAILLAYAGLVIFVLSTVGIPLGAESRPLAANQSAILLLLGGAAAAVGGARRTGAFR